MRKFPLLLTKAVLWIAMVCALTQCNKHPLQHAIEPNSTLATPAAPPEAQDQISRPVSEPYDGDLAIFEDRQCARKLQIDRVMNLLGLKEGLNVADIGAGSGWFTMRAARRVGKSGLVYAVEINPDYLKHMDVRAKQNHLLNIHIVQGTEDDPKLPTASIDAALILNTYHEVAQPIRLLEHLHQAMKPQAALGIIDRNGKGDDHGISSQIIIDEAKRAGFSLKAQYDFVKPGDMDYFLIFHP